MSRDLKEHGIKLREQIYQYISNYINDMGYSPTVREIGKAVGLKSSSSVYKHLTLLENEGRIESKPNCPRTIKIIKK